MIIRQDKPEAPFAKDIDYCYKALEELKGRCAKLRKAAKDPVLAEFLLRNIKSKIQYAEVTRSTADIDRIKTTLDEAKQELDNAEQEAAVDFRKEIAAMTGVPEKESK